MSDRPTGSYAKDPRVDRVITWVLTTVAGAAFAWGAQSFSELREGISGNTKAITQLTVSMEAGKVIEQRLSATEKRVDEIARGVSSHHLDADAHSKTGDNARRIDRLERDLEKIKERTSDR